MLKHFQFELRDKSDQEGGSQSQKTSFVLAKPPPRNVLVCFNQMDTTQVWFGLSVCYSPDHCANPQALT